MINVTFTSANKGYYLFLHASLGIFCLAACYLGLHAVLLFAISIAPNTGLGACDVCLCIVKNAELVNF